MNDATFDYLGLGYVGIGSPDPTGWRDFATSVCGLMPAPMLPGASSRTESSEPGIAPDGTAFLKMDDRQWRLAVHARDAPSLEYLGFELRHERAFEEACESIAKRGAEIREGTSDERSNRGVGRLAVLVDPAGHRVELFSSPLRDRDYVSPSGMEFLTGEFGMGHAVLYVPDIEAALDYYRDVLGFVRSDYMNFGPGGLSIHFLRCTRRHHSVALLHLGALSGLQHLMLETTTLDDVGRALDRAYASKVPITSGLGRHRNDETVSFYMQSPSGVDFELGWDGLIIDDGWTENEFAGGGDLWGHHGLDAESLQPKEES